MKEEWRPVRNYEGLYEVSNMGRIKSLERTVWDNRGYYRTVPERIMKGKKSGAGYLQVHLSKDDKKKWYLIADTTIEAEPFMLEPKENESQKYVTMNPQAICILVGK